MNKAILCVLVVVGVLLQSGIAGAHSDRSQLTVVAATNDTTLSARFDVRVTFTGDGHSITGSTVSAVAIRPGEAAQTPVLLLEREAGLYSGSIAVPSSGEWTVRFTAVRPIGTVEVPHTFVGSAPAAAASVPADAVSAGGVGQRAPFFAGIVALGVTLFVAVFSAVFMWKRRPRNRRVSGVGPTANCM